MLYRVNINIKLVIQLFDFELYGFTHETRFKSNGDFRTILFHHICDKSNSGNKVMGYHIILSIMAYHAYIRIN